MPRLSHEEAAIRREHTLVALKPFTHGAYSRDGSTPTSIAGRWQARCRCGKFFGPTKTKKHAMELHLEHVNHEAGNIPPWVRP